MEKGKPQPGRDMGLDARRSKGDLSLQPPTPDVDARDYDAHVGDPDVKVKEIKDDVEFQSSRGPLGSGD